MKHLLQKLFLSFSLICVGQSVDFMEGFPSALLCNDGCTKDNPAAPNIPEPATLECEIFIGNSTNFYVKNLFSRTDDINEVYCDGLVTDVPGDWLGPNKMLTWTYLTTRESGAKYLGGTSESLVVERRRDFKCLKLLPTKRISVLGGNVTLTCDRVWTSNLFKEQFDAINIVWYKGCEKIGKDSSTYHYEELEDTDRKFPSLTITNATVENSGGYYHCVAEYKSLTAALETYELCVLENKSSTTHSIAANHEKIDVASGGNVTVECLGNGDENTMVVWKKDNRKTIDCVSSLPEHPMANYITPQENMGCTHQYCVSDGTRNSIGTFVSTLTMRNATYDFDAGQYTCYYINDELGYWMNNTDIKESLTITVDGRSAASIIIPLHLGVNLIAAVIVMVVSI